MRVLSVDRTSCPGSTYGGTEDSLAKRSLIQTLPPSRFLGHFANLNFYLGDAGRAAVIKFFQRSCHGRAKC
jgi:hypothetical protein